MNFHNNIIQLLKDPSSWAGFAGVMTSLGLQLSNLYSPTCYLLGAIFSVIAIVINPQSKK
ncbi:MAG: hypothetical protein WCJ33_03720 [Pseudomonadota bacterium]